MDSDINRPLATAETHLRRFGGPILNAMLGAQLLSTTADGNDHIKRLTRSLELLLPAIVVDTSLAYFREFLAREYLRQPQATGSPE